MWSPSHFKNKTTPKKMLLSFQIKFPNFMCFIIYPWPLAVSLSTTEKFGSLSFIPFHQVLGHIVKIPLHLEESQLSQLFFAGQMLQALHHFAGLVGLSPVCPCPLSWGAQTCSQGSRHWAPRRDHIPQPAGNVLWSFWNASQSAAVIEVRVELWSSPISKKRMFSDGDKKMLRYWHDIKYVLHLEKNKSAFNELWGTILFFSRKDGVGFLSEVSCMCRALCLGGKWAVWTPL